MTRLKVLISAYACEPGLGSEPGVGWNLACSLGTLHDVWVITRANNRSSIESALADAPMASVHWVYYDLPKTVRALKRGQFGVRPYYYLWQIGILRVARQLHEDVKFDVVQHATFAKYWSPSLLSRINAPFVFGPVGGGESAPFAFWMGFGFRGVAYETARHLLRWLSERDPMVRRTLRESEAVLVTTEEAAARVASIGAEGVHVLPEAALSQQEIDELGRRAEMSSPDRPLRFVSMGRLLHFKAFDLALRAFADTRLEDAEFWIVGAGPKRASLERLSARLGIAGRTRFLGALPRKDALDVLCQCDILVHPSLHESGGWVCLEAMAAARPVICMDLGGTAVQVTEKTGIKIPALSRSQAVQGIASAMQLLGGDPVLRATLGQGGRRRVRESFEWTARALEITGVYEDVVGRQ